MAFRAGSYPHPVLGHEDDVASEFEIINTRVEPAVEDIAIRFRLRTNDPDLQSMISQGTAKLVVSWACPATLSSGELELTATQTYRDGKAYVGWLDQKDLRETFEVNFFAVATDEISDHRWQRQHSDYGDTKFAIREGDILAVAGGFSFRADKMYDPMQPPVSSCFRIVVDDRIGRNFELRFDDDEAVLILVSSQMAAGLKSLAVRPDYQMALVVLPALVETIHYIQATDSDNAAEDLHQSDWYKILKSHMGNDASGWSPALRLSQEILSHPIHDALAQPILEEDDEWDE